MTPNSEQIGGDHYKSDWQHWDLVEDFGIGYLEAVATKYVIRHRRKDGIKDLDKAMHFVDKLIEVGRGPKGCVQVADMDKFAVENKLSAAEAAICQVLFGWENPRHLTYARSLIQDLKDRTIREATLTVPKAGSLSFVPPETVKKTVAFMNTLLIGFDMHTAHATVAMVVLNIVHQYAKQNHASVETSHMKFEMMVNDLLFPSPDGDKETTDDK